MKHIRILGLGLIGAAVLGASALLPMGAGANSPRTSTSLIFRDVAAPGDGLQDARADMSGPVGYGQVQYVQDTDDGDLHLIVSLGRAVPGQYYAVNFELTADHNHVWYFPFGDQQAKTNGGGLVMYIDIPGWNLCQTGPGHMDFIGQTMGDVFVAPNIKYTTEFCAE